MSYRVRFHRDGKNNLYFQDRVLFSVKFEFSCGSKGNCPPKRGTGTAQIIGLFLLVFSLASRLDRPLKLTKHFFR